MSPDSLTPSPVPRPDRSRFFVALIALGALILRVVGITWGLPSAERAFSYHPDESVVVGFSLVVNPLLLLLDPGFYNYGSLGLLVNGFFIHLGEWVGLVASGPAPSIPSASALLTARLVTALLGAATCLFLYGTGRCLFHARAGLWAALLYAAAPLAVQHGHFATVDVPAVFWMTGSLFFAARHTSRTSHTSDVRRPRDLLWAGLWAGLAAATKYNAGLIVLSGAAAWWLIRPRSSRGLLELVGGAVVGFLVGCPGVLLNFAQFRAGLLFEAQHVREGHGAVFAATSPALWYHLTFNLPWAMGWPLVLLGLAGLGYALWKRRPADLLLAAFTVPYYLLIGLAEVKFARYTLPLLPPLFLWIAALVPPPSISAIAATPARKVGAPLASALVGIGTLYALVMACGFDQVMLGPDPRDEAARYVRQRGITSVGFATGPWFYAPPLHPGLAAPAPPRAKAFAREAVHPRLIPAEGEWNRSQLTGADAPRAVFLSEINEYADAERSGNQAVLAYLDALGVGYPNRKIFARPVTFLGIPVTHLQTRRGDREILPTQNLPHDMLYTNPTTVLFSQ